MHTGCSSGPKLFVPSLCSRLNHIFKRRLLSLSVFDAYEKIAELTIEDSIKNELSGDFERLMLAVGERLCRPLDHTEQLQVVYSTNCSFSCSFFAFPHSPVHQERSHVLCQAPLQVNEGKRRAQCYTVWESLGLLSYKDINETWNFHSVTVFKSRKIIRAAHSCTCVFWFFPESIPGTRYRWQHPDPDHDLPLWDRHAGHPRVFPSQIWEVALQHDQGQSSKKTSTRINNHVAAHFCIHHRLMTLPGRHVGWLQEDSAQPLRRRRRVSGEQHDNQQRATECHIV